MRVIVNIDIPEIPYNDETDYLLTLQAVVREDFNLAADILISRWREIVDKVAHLMRTRPYDHEYNYNVEWAREARKAFIQDTTIEEKKLILALATVLKVKIKTVRDGKSALIH